MQEARNDRVAQEGRDLAVFATMGWVAGAPFGAGAVLFVAVNPYAGLFLLAAGALIYPLVIRAAIRDLLYERRTR